MVHPDNWLTLTQAANKLGVHPGTLRRWADAGQISILLTPGGHRRFAAADVERFSEERRRLRTMSGLEQVWAEQAIGLARHELATQPEKRWLTVFGDEEREHKRLLGRRLMGLMQLAIAAAYEQARNG